MNDLYDKIYEAVDKGIYEALILPDEMDNDVSVVFQHKKLTNNVNQIDHYVYELLNSNDARNAYNELKKYDRMIKRRTDSFTKYSPKSFIELINILKTIKSIVKTQTLFNIAWMDTSEYISLILADGSEIPFDNFIYGQDNVQFVRIRNTYCPHDIILYANIQIPEPYRYAWVRYNDEMFNQLDMMGGIKLQVDAEEDYDGYNNTYKDLYMQNISLFPMIQHCCRLNDIHPHYQCYVPALGEMIFLYDNYILINYIFYIINNGKTNKRPNFDKYITFMTSTLGTEHQIWRITMQPQSRSTDKIHFFAGLSTLDRYLMPLFKKIE